MRGYVCTYRNPRPRQLDFDLTVAQAEATNDEDLRSFLRAYDDSFWDWVDDPSFFAAAQQLGNVSRASWGVCRPDVRKRLSRGDLVVFFCTKQRATSWDYYFIGYATVERCISRSTLWRSAEFAKFRSFYNVLARVRGPKREQQETFFPRHKDWSDRADMPYVLFDPMRSCFNLDTPLRVARWTDNQPQEQWLKSSVVQRLEQLIFRDRGITRRLRTRGPFPHAKLNLAARRKGALDVPGLRIALREFVDA